MTSNEIKEIPAEIPLRKRIVYGAMGSAAAVGSLLAGSCLSRCNGCMGCLAGGAGLVGILAGSKMIEKLSSAGKSAHVQDNDNEANAK